MDPIRFSFSITSIGNTQLGTYWIKIYWYILRSERINYMITENFFFLKIVNNVEYLIRESNIHEIFNCCISKLYLMSFQKHTLFYYTIGWILSQSHKVSDKAQVTKTKSHTSDGILEIVYHSFHQLTSTEPHLQTWPVVPWYKHTVWCFDTPAAALNSDFDAYSGASVSRYTRPGPAHLCREYKSQLAHIMLYVFRIIVISLHHIIMIQP